MFQSRVFLEIRMLIATDTKAFCGCPAGPSSNGVSCPVCRQEKGAIPLLNNASKKTAWVLARALNCTILDTCVYNRFPSGVNPDIENLSQLSLKIAVDGFIDIEFHCRKKRIRIEEFRIEEDTGRLTRAGNNTRMDCSHAGSVSLHIRTAPDLELGEEAELFLNELRRRIQYLELCPGEPVEAITRCNAYVALARFPHEPEFYVKLRNLNSFNFVRKGINSELNRQEDILSEGGVVTSESRIWNELQNRTESFQRRNPIRDDRYLSADEVPPCPCPTEVKTLLDTFDLEPPSARQSRFVAQYGLSNKLAQNLCDEKSRADFFERTLECGADPIDTAHWLAGDVVTLLRRSALNLTTSPLTPERFAWIITAFHNRQIHSRLARRLLQTILEENLDPPEIIAKYQWENLSDPVRLNDIIDVIIAENPRYKGSDKDDPSGMMEYVTGIVMKKTGGLADPSAVKEILKKKLNLNFIYVLAMGGVLCGQKTELGTITAGDEKFLKHLADDCNATEQIASRLRFENVLTSQHFSEEIDPHDWATLIAKIAEILASGTAEGIVIAHGADILPYTSALLYWLFGGAPLPIVLTAAFTAGGNAVRPADTLLTALQTVSRQSAGVYVVVGNQTFSPLNLKFLQNGENGFCNWNLERPIFTGTGLLDDETEIDPFAVSGLMQEAAGRLFVCRVYPGMRADKLLPVISDGVEYLLLELFDNGAGSMRGGDYSLKPLITRCSKMNCTVLCSSQQNTPVVFGEYAVSHQVWRKGVVPLQHLTTESAVALYFAAAVVADTKEEHDRIIEEKIF